MTNKEAVKGFAGKKVLVVGDLGLDRYIHGHCARLCQEAPVPVFTPSRNENRAGLAGNVATNAAALGADVRLCSIIGDDQDGEDLRNALEVAGVRDIERYVCTGAKRTTVKTRFVSDWRLMLRMDEENVEIPPPNVMAKFVDGVTKEIRGWADVVVIQDYAKGLLGRAMLEEIIHAAYIREKAVIVDPSPKQDPRIYHGATYLKPNLIEAIEMAKLLGIDEYQGMMRRLGLSGLLVTLGSRGMNILTPKSADWVEAKTKEVYDVCGAGDTVTAVLALGIASGLSFFDSSVLANAAAGVVVGKFGTATLSADELMEVL